MRAFAALLRSTSLRVAAVVAVAITVLGTQMGTAGAIPPAVLTASASPSSATSGETVTVQVDVEGCWMDQPESGDLANIYLYPVGVGRYDGKTTTLTPEIQEGSSAGDYQATASVPVDDLIDNAGGTTGTFQVDAGVNGKCGVTLQDDVDQVTLSSAPATTTTTSTTTTTTSTTLPATTTTTTWRYTGSDTDRSGFRLVLVDNEYGQIQLRLVTECTSTWTYTSTSGSSWTMDCVSRRELVFVAGTAGSFAPGTEVVLWLFSDPVEVGSTTANAAGGFDEMAIRVPDLPPGRHELRAVGTAPDGTPVTYVMPIEVRDGTPGSLAFTGTTPQTPWLALGGVMAVLLGVVLIGWTLRPEPVLVEMRSLRPIEPIEPGRRHGGPRRHPRA